VLCDRFVDSTYAYQGGGSGLDRDALRGIQHFATDGLEPDARVLLDLPVEIGLRRRHADAGSVNRIDLADVRYHERVREAYLHLVAEAPDLWIVIDARNDPDVVQLQIWSQLHERLAIA
jgi:dTMP kinase